MNRARLATNGTVLASALGLAGLSAPALSHTGNFIVYRNNSGQLGIQYAWPVPTLLDETLAPYRGDVFNVLIERIIIPNVALDMYPPNQGTQIYLEVIEAVPRLVYRDGGNPTRIIGTGANAFFAGTGGTAWTNPGVWIHADQFHPQWDWNAQDWYVRVRAFDATGVHTPSPIYSMEIVMSHYCGADFTTTAIPGSPGYGEPNQAINNDDFFYFLTLFAEGHWRADLTSTALQGAPGYGDQNGIVNNDDFFYYLNEFMIPCHF